MGKRYIGERILQNCGEYAELIELLPSNECKVRFDDGTEKVCKRGNFTSGKVSVCDVRDVLTVGKKVIQNCGMEAEVIELLPGYRCRIRFENGVEKECYRGNFTSGIVSYRNKRQMYVGEKLMQQCGLEVTLIKLLPKGRCIVRFQSGEEIDCERSNFRSGKVSINSPLVDVGDVVFQDCGMYAECIELLDGCRCRVQFENSVIKEPTIYAFKKGKVSNFVRSKVGDVVMQKCGIGATLVELLHNKRCRIRFTDGLEKECFLYQFKNGRVGHNSN